MEPFIDKLIQNAVAAAGIIIALILFLKDRRADARDRAASHAARERAQLQIAQEFTDALDKRDKLYIDAQNNRDETFVATIREITQGAAKTAADCHAVHREGIQVMARVANTHERVTAALERVERLHQSAA